jgi:hypothetical protein
MESKRECGRCRTPLTDDGPAYHCSNECTFCATCYRAMRYTCPNCGGELVRRPRTGPSRIALPVSVSRPATRVNVHRANVEDVASIGPLFDAYRQFYERPPDLEAAKKFLSDRLLRHESVVLVAELDGAAVGFVQLYPLFSSISLGPVYVLNDLYVVPKARHTGVGATLLESARAFGRLNGAHYMELSTAVDNPAQRLYETSGWLPDREFLHYELPLSPVPKSD